MEDIRSASRGRPKEESGKVTETEYEMGSSYTPHSHEGTGKRAQEIKKQEQINSTGEGEIEKQILTSLTDKEDRQKLRERGGALEDDAFLGKEIELANELLLVALGLGQNRGEDGSTTLFEQEAIFGQIDENKSKSKIQDVVDSKAAAIDVQNEEPRNITSKASELGSKAWEAATLSFGSKVSKKSVQANTKTHTTQKATEKAALKPNEPCHYDARARSIIFVAVTAMGVRGIDVYMAEKVIAQTIYFILSEGRSEAVKQGKEDPLQSQETQQSARQSWMNSASQGAVAREKIRGNWGRYLATGAGVAVGGAIIGLTGGLAAPIVAPALIGLTGGFTFLATTGGIVMIGTLLGVTGGGLAGYKVQRRLRGIDYFEFHEIQSEARQAGVVIPSLHATICCSGLLLKTDKQGAVFESVFHNTTDARDVYSIKAEEKMMQDAGEGLRGYVLDTAIKTGGRKVGEEVIKHTALAGLAALALPLTIFGTASAALDSVFVQAKSRSYRAGLILADVLKNETQGHRPVTLIGTSLGCYTILTALVELAKSPEENMHLVDSVYLIGGPITPSPSTIRRARSITARRFVNAYTRDMVCSIAAWLGSGISLEELRGVKLPKVMGCQPVLECPGVENINVEDLVPDGHFDLNRSAILDQILQRCRALE